MAQNLRNNLYQQYSKPRSDEETMGWDLYPYTPDQAMQDWEGSVSMAHSCSTDSGNSRHSYFSNYTPVSPCTSMTSPDDFGSSYPGYSDPFQNSGSLQNMSISDSPPYYYPDQYQHQNFQPQSSRVTPSELKWDANMKIEEFYKFYVPKSKEPYLALHENALETFRMPRIVYLDKEETIDKKHHPCQFPGTSCWKTNTPPVFSRPADLERHYRQVHASEDQKENHYCDYRNCNRSNEPFTRKDHFRDHLKEYHKEDIGYCKGEKTAKDKAKWAAKQRSWEAERRISDKWWRCVKCLDKIYVAEYGWQCPSCKRDCEAHRREAREQKAEYGGNASDMVQASSSSSSSKPFSPPCTVCDGLAWIENPNGSWEVCAYCQVATAEQMPSTSMSQYTTATQYATGGIGSWDQQQWDHRSSID
ncbi:hypothetical protein G7Y89_g4526 [Cudoniella acicularis]|uniref:C2H2-type domain-containing protein n=1 Tax=Cudoniella acicularis TaxID=354080 RepID=A0A8H4RRF4_9HELO|nr:hypothetical protein G7Y89_g4526 [Cudoniella acicularis]